MVKQSIAKYWGEEAKPGGYGKGPRIGFRAEDRGFDNPCWIWTGNILSIGYGVFGEGSNERYRKVYAHRRSYELAYGPISEGLQIDHLCRVRSCINPEHLEAVTSAINTKRGNAGGPASICAKAVDELKRLVASGKCSTNAAAKRVGISNSHAYRIMAGEVKTWGV